MISAKQRLRRIDKTLADRLAAERGELNVPTVFAGEDGSFWVLAHELREYGFTVEPGEPQ